MTINLRLLLAQAWLRQATVEGLYAAALLTAEQGDWETAMVQIPPPPGKNEWYPDLMERTLFHAILDVQSSEGVSFFREMNAAGANELAELLDGMLSTYAYNRGFGRIDNLLCFHHGLCRPPLTGGAGEGPKMLRLPTHTDTPANIRRSAFSVAPNPAHDQLTLRYRFADEVGSGSLCLRDVIGRMVLQERLSGGEGSAVLPTGSIGRGVYVLEVRGDGQLVHKEKILLE